MQEILKSLKNFLLKYLGTLDTNHFANQSLLHGFKEMYGSYMTGQFLVSLSHLFTLYLQKHGFSCG